MGNVQSQDIFQRFLLLCLYYPTVNSLFFYIFVLPLLLSLYLYIPARDFFNNFPFLFVNFIIFHIFSLSLSSFFFSFSLFICIYILQLVLSCFLCLLYLFWHFSIFILVAM